MMAWSCGPSRGTAVTFGCLAISRLPGRRPRRHPRALAPLRERKGGPCVSTVSIVCNPHRAPAGVGASQVDKLSSQPGYAGPQGCCSESAPDPLSLTLLTVLTVFSGNERIRITLLPDRPSRPNAISIPSARRNVCARRKWPARARGFFAQPVPSFGIRSLLRSTLTRRRSAALPVQEGRSLMNSRTQAAIGSASIMLSIAALRLAA
jgi:hypothetical protein